MRTTHFLFMILLAVSGVISAHEPELISELVPRDIHAIPGGFPHFEVPAHEEELNTVRQMFYHHYIFYPGATYNDVYIPMSIVWADTGDDPRYEQFRKGLRSMLEGRRLDSEGYLSCQQHIGLAHPEGWPFPLWIQSEGMGWHFSNDDVWIWKECGTEQCTSLDGWKVAGLAVDKIENEFGLHAKFASERVVMTTPTFEAKGLISPFLVLHWWLQGVDAGAVFYVEWTTQKQPGFSPKRRSYFCPSMDGDHLIQTPVPLHPLLAEEDVLRQVRVVIENARGGTMKLERLFTAADTRHHINSFVWIQGSDDYLNWTGDLAFLRSQIQRWRNTLHYSIEEFQVAKEQCVDVPWVGHDGRAGLIDAPEKEHGRISLYGRGLGGTYFDIIPCGGKDAYATVFLYDALNRMADLEEAIGANPQWNIPCGPLSFEPVKLRNLASEVKKKYQTIFWNPKTKRFLAGLDRDGKMHDYGFLYFNLEAIYYDLPSSAQAKEVYRWINGERIVQGDTSQGKDIYHWRFAPRTTTKRNLEYYGYSWAPRVFAWGDQVQDGGAVLAWSYYDLMNRIRLFGPDDAWERLSEIIDWFDEVQAEGGYREYYKKPGRGRLQGGNVAGGLGLDCEFLENVMVPQVMIYGFMGLEPGLESIEVNPNLPREWPELTIRSIRWHGNLLDITAREKQILVQVREGDPDDVVVTSKNCKVRISK